MEPCTKASLSVYVAVSVVGPKVESPRVMELSRRRSGKSPEGRAHPEMQGHKRRWARKSSTVHEGQPLFSTLLADDWAPRY